MCEPLISIRVPQRRCQALAGIAILARHATQIYDLSPVFPGATRSERFFDIFTGTATLVTLFCLVSMKRDPTVTRLDRLSPDWILFASFVFALATPIQGRCAPRLPPA